MTDLCVLMTLNQFKVKICEFQKMPHDCGWLMHCVLCLSMNVSNCNVTVACCSQDFLVLVHLVMVTVAWLNKINIFELVKKKLYGNLTPKEDHFK